MTKIALITHQDFAKIEQNAQTLGRCERTGCRFHKLYLANNTKGQWQLVKLGPIDILRRRFLGAFKHTHLKHVARAWSSYQHQQANFCPKITLRMTKLWSKTYPKETCAPYDCMMTLLGNAPLAEAQVIGIGQLYTDRFDALMTGKFLSTHYKEGDIILVEGFDVDKKIDAKQVPTLAYLDKPADVQGWEPVDYTELHNKVFETSIAFDFVLRSSITQVLALLTSKQSGQNVTNVEWSQIDQALTYINKVLKKIEESDPKDAAATEFQKELGAMHQAFHKTAGAAQDCTSFLNAFIPLAEDISALLEKKKYTSLWPKEADIFFKASWPIRQESLSDLVDHYRGEGKRVFVCAGAKHFFPNRAKAESEVHKTLSKHKFTIGLANTYENDSYYSFHELFNKYTQVETATA